MRARKRLILGRDDSLGWNINRIPEPFTGEVVLPEQADVGRWDDGVVGNGSPDLRFDLIGGGLVDARSDARDPIEPRKLIFKIRREIIIKMTGMGEFSPPSMYDKGHYHIYAWPKGPQVIEASPASERA